MSVKKQKVKHPLLYFNNCIVKSVTEHKNLGLILDSKLSFHSHVSEKISKARRGIGLIKNYLPIFLFQTVEQIYMVYIRPHLDYCDVIFHRPESYNDNNYSLYLNHNMKLLESAQYQAALAITGAWKDSSHDELLL